MASDIVVALKEASANGTTLFGLNHHAAPNARHRLVSARGKMHDLGEIVRTSTLSVPQARQTFGVLGLQSRDQWGFINGVNEHRVVLGMTEWTSRLPCDAKGLSGPDLVRLTLERCHSAHHGIEVLADLLERHAPQAGNDLIFLVADGNEAFVLEASGRYWASLECGHLRVVTDAAMIRQDWSRLAPGLASFVIEKNWWQDDGSKIDFVRCLGNTTDQAKFAQKRWGRASLALTQQQGAIDGHFLRRMLGDHYTSCRDLLPNPKVTSLASSFVVELPHRDHPLIAWVAFGTPKVHIYFPICFAGELPTAFGDVLPTSTSIEDRTADLLKLANGKDADRLVLALERLQTRFDQDVEDFVARAHEHPTSIPLLATEMMESHVQLFDKEYCRLFGVEARPTMSAPMEEEVLFFA